MHEGDPVLGRLQVALSVWSEKRVSPTSSITGRGAIRELELQFSGALGGRPTLAVNSGSAALRVALEAVGVGAGSEVICPRYDWPAAAAAIQSLNALPIFAAIEKASLTIDPDDVTTLVTPHTRAVVATHLFGHPADVPRLRTHLDPIGIPVVEDCAHGIGARIDGEAVGTLGTAAAFSLGPGKPVDAGEGGIVVFASEELHHIALQRSQHPTRQTLAGISAIHLSGFNQRIHPAAAVLGLWELETLPERLSLAADHARRVHDAVATGEGMHPMTLEPRREPNWYRVVILWDGSGAPPPSVVLDKPGASVLGGETNTSLEAFVNSGLYVGRVSRGRQP